MVANLRQRQSDGLVRMLHLNATPNTATRTDEETFKVLVLDQYTKNVLAPLLRVNDLRKHGVTLHLMIEAERQPIPDVPAVYFVSESDANVDRIAADARQGLYDSLYINFVGHVPLPLLDRLASVAARDASAQRITQVFDKYLSFISLETGLFSLGLHDTYVALNDPRKTDKEIEVRCVLSRASLSALRHLSQAEVDRVVEGLFCVLATAGVVPIIRCPKGGAAEHVAQKLSERIRAHLTQRNNLFSEAPTGLSASLTRPLLCLFDRNFELSVVLQHSWTYKPLVHDVLGMSLNRISIAEGAGGPSSPRAGGKKSYEVGDGDAFWAEHGRKQFPKVAEEVENLVAAYKQAGADVLDPDEADQAATRNLMAAVSSLPELTEKKRVMDKHTELATALLGPCARSLHCVAPQPLSTGHIKARGLDQFYNTEEDLLGGKGTVSRIQQLLTGQRGSAMDKLRLVLVFLLTCEELPSDAELQRLESTLSALGADMHAFAYVLRMRKMKLTGQKMPPSQSYAEGLGALSSQSNNLINWADKTFGQGLSSLTKGVKNLLAGEQQAAVTVAVEQLMGGFTPDKEDTFAYFDPKARGGGRQPGPFKEAIVFMVGGGNYLEYESLATWAQRSQPPKTVMYGATELLNGEAFVEQLCELGGHSLR